MTAAVALALFVALNPFMTARPSEPLPPPVKNIASLSLWQRFDFQMRHRFQVSESQKLNFPHNALHTIADKTKVFAVQGFGRFGLLGPLDADSTVRFDRRQDLGAISWGPLVLFGLVRASLLGVGQFRAGQPPTARCSGRLGYRGVGRRHALSPHGLGPLPAADSKRQRLAGRHRGRRHLETSGDTMRMIVGRPETWVFLVLLASYSFFWQRRDWNTASRLMLTYSIVDRGTVAITGLEIQTEDKAKFQGQFYSDKFPGFSLLATVPYALARLALGLPGHPINQQKAFAYWAADYWCTLGISGLFTAATAVLLALSARELGCSASRACFIGLAYGLATPAYVYATLAYGHQASAFALFASFFLLRKKAKRPRESVYLLLAGFLAAYAAVIELQVGPVSAILGFYLLAQCLRGHRRPDAPGAFCRRGDRSNLDPPDLQPARLRLTLGHGLSTSHHTRVRPCP